MPFVERPEDLNESQWDAVRYPLGHLLIMAGPGTGKTHTLTCRILHHLPEVKQDQKILAVTFTNKASRQMRDRLLARSGLPEIPVEVMTFHQFCLDILQRYFSADLPQNFRVANSDEIQQAWGEVWPTQKQSWRKRAAVEISRWKADPRRPPGEYGARYDEHLRGKGLLDFDDLLLEAVRLLRDHRETLGLLRRRYPFIFIDEYQDINPIQHELVKLLTGQTGAVTAIGDPLQAIYGFRGSDPRLFDSFENDFPGAKVLTLTDNYRNARQLLSASRQVMLPDRAVRVPELTARIHQEGRLVIHESATDRAEAEYIAHGIEKLVGGTSHFSGDSGRVGHGDEAAYGFGDIAILVRLNSQRDSIEEALDRGGIPYRVNEEREYDNPEESLRNSFKHEPGQDKVSLMTLHASKGLEFPVVFIAGCESGLIPLARTDEDTDLAEERRLFYVGLTRAKERLYLVRAAKRRMFGKVLETLPSPFLADIEEDLKEYEQPGLKTRRKKKDDQLKMFG